MVRLARTFAQALGVIAVSLLSTGTARAAETATESLTTPGEHQFVVPAGVTSLQVLLVGGNGGVSDGNAVGGLPATAAAALSVAPGETLFAEVAGNGGPADVPGGGPGGYGGGSAGGEVFALFGSASSAGGGGGASDIRECSATSTCNSLASRLLVAGGGGGGGGNGIHVSTQIAGGTGGAAGFPGLKGSSDGAGDTPGSAGGEATATAGGSAGESGQENAGALGVGGGGQLAVLVGGGGGGGGGGLYGGGGGGAGAGHVVGGSEGFGSGGGGGGGGSSGVPAGASGVSNFTTPATAHGAQPHIEISWTRPAPAVLTTPATDLTSAGATLTGTVNPNGSQLTDCHFTLAPAPAGEATLPCSQQVGAASTPIGVTAAVSGLAPSSTFTATLVAGSAQGTTAGTPVTFVTSALPAAARPLSLSAVTLTPARFRLGSRAATVAAARRHRLAATGATLSVVLSQAATLTLSFERAGSGVILRRTCHAATTRRHSGRRCKLYRRVPDTLTLSAPAGRDTVAFDGVLDHGTRLAPGSYRLTVAAAATGAQAKATQRPTFALVR